ncbi:MAG TPA: VOC family protein [Planosporangium sp.]|nr:VOC family protein [Planosporangium sp.]
MTLASFKDLCMDAGDALSQARFWASVLGASPVDLGDGSARLDPTPGRTSGEVVWIDPVPEPRTVKTRVHLDLRLAEPTPAAILRAGATVVREPGDDRWWVLADPEGNEFCAFPPNTEAAQPPGVFELVVDCRDAWAQTAWWAGVTGGKANRPDEGAFAWVEGAAGFPWQYWVFAEVPEAKIVKNRVHWDVDLAAATPDALVEAGAVVLRAPGADIRWWVLADPEGNEFCAFPAES